MWYFTGHSAAGSLQWPARLLSTLGQMGLLLFLSPAYQPALAYPLYPFRALENETLMYAKSRFLIFFNLSLIPD